MSDFHDVRFPLSLSFGSAGGPEWQTDIFNLASGSELRQTRHARSRRRYNVGAGLKSLDDVRSLLAFFEARRGRLHPFRFRDPLDYMSSQGPAISATDQIIGYGDGATTDFFLSKTYADAAGQYTRNITKPVVGQLQTALDGLPTPVSVDYLTGRIVFNTPPQTGSVVTAGFEFDVPVRFDLSQLDVALETFGAGEVANIPLIEVFDDA